MLSRRELFALSTLSILLQDGAQAQTAGRSPLYRNYSRCLPDYLRGLAKEAYDRRNRKLALLTTPAAIRAYQRWVTQTFWELVGGMPERTPLNPRTTGKIERDGYRVEKVIYESQPNFLVSGNLYIPTSVEPPFPGVLFQMGHSLNGKAGEVYQRCCQGLAKLGYLVLGFDPMGQGERTYYPGSEPFISRFLDADKEHTYPGRQMLLKGDTSTRLQTWDSVRSLDYLASHPLVDPKRLASTGQSGGGTNTMLLAAVDNRLVAAAISCPNSENVACRNFNPPGATDDAEQNLLASGPLGFDRWDLLYPLAPKPLLVLVSERDAFGTYSPNYIENGLEEFQKLRGVYERLGHPERLNWHSTPLPHGLAYEMRLQIYNWFEHWLKGNTRPIEEEPPTRPEEDATLFVTDSGSVIRSFPGETPFSLNQKRKITLKTANLAELLGVEKIMPRPFAVLSASSFRNTKIEAVEFLSAPKGWIPGWLYLPKKKLDSKPLIIVIEPGGRGSWHEGELYDDLASEGCPVCAVDLRGIGDLTPEFGRNAARHARSHNSEEHYAWSSLIFGKPLLGQRVTDLLAVVEGLRTKSDLKNHRLIIAARGSMTVPALFAAALDSRVDAVYLSEGLVSFQNFVDTEDYDYPFGNVVPNLLAYTDLPELAAGLAPRRVALAGTVNAARKRMSVKDVEAKYQGLSNVRIIPEPSWTAASIMTV